MAERTPRAQTPPELAEIAKWVLGISGVGILSISVVALWGARGTPQFPQTTQLVFNSLLPLLGTWVGTVLAYYFSRKNFESASESVERMVTLTTEQKLRELSVEKEMIRLPEITLYQIPAGKSPGDVLLKDVEAKLGGKITRVPIVDADGVVLYIVHQSVIYKFLAQQARSGKPPEEIDRLTLQDLVDDAELNRWVTNIAFIDEEASVAEAKSKMEQQSGCQDLVVTKTGKKDEAMLGWMTNVDIGQLSKA